MACPSCGNPKIVHFVFGWRMKCGEQIHRAHYEIISNCPFCGTKLPYIPETPINIDRVKSLVTELKIHYEKMLVSLNNDRVDKYDHMAHITENIKLIEQELNGIDTLTLNSINSK